MSEHNKAIQEFLDTACNQIRYKSIHKSIIDELTDHIEEQKIQYIKKGYSQEEATAKAIEQMGDPVLVGKELDKAHRPKTEWSILSLVAILILIGGAVQFIIFGENPMGPESFLHFIMYASIGLVAFTFTYFFDYTLIARYSKLIYFIHFGITLADFTFSPRVNGTHPHIYGFALLFIPIFAGIIYSFKGKSYWAIIVCGLFYGGAALLCLIAPKTSSLILLSVACLIILTVAIAKGYFKGNKKVSLAIVYIPMIMSFIGSIVFLFFQSPIRRKRIAIMLNPELDPYGQGFHLLMVKRVIQASQAFGKAVLSGEIENIPIHEMLPGWSTDFSLTYIIGNFGFATGLIIIGIVSVFIVRMFISVIKQKNSFGYLLSLSACIALTSQFVLYVLSNLGIFTVFSSLTLPFISFGGTSFVVNMVLAGLVLSVYRRTNIVDDRMVMYSHNRKLVKFEDGKIIIDLGLNKSKKQIE
jgi:cell division protein FtsW (lipid II flippase)